MVRRPAQHAIISILLMMVVLLPAACTDDVPRTGTVTPTPTRATSVPTAPPTSSPTPVGTRNTLAISEPLPYSTITDTVNVKGEGMAFENTIIVEVVANGTTLGSSIVTTTAQPGEIGKFTTLVTV